MTVYEWLNSKDGIIVNFDKCIDGDYIKILKIQMDAKCIYSVCINDHTLTQFPITVEKTFYSDQIPNNDTAMIFVLDQMYEDLIDLFDSIC